MSEFERVRLGDLVDSISVKHKFDKDKLVFLNTSDILNGEILHHNYNEVSKFPGQAKKTINNGDILYSEIRPKNRRFAFVDFDSEDYVVSTKLMVLRVKADTRVLVKYVYYYLTMDQTINQLQSIAEYRSGTFPQITFSELSSLEIPLPSIDEQERIVDIIESIDRKESLNHEMNETLEEMAMTLYKHWFVDFGPFQDGEFVESEWGMIPKNWEIHSLYNIADFVNGKAFKMKNLNDFEGLPVIKIAELKSGITRNTKFYMNKYDMKHEINDGGILFAWSASLGVYMWTKGKALLNQHIFNVQPKEKSNITKPLIYFILKRVINKFVSIAAGRATTMGHITKQHLIDEKIALPTSELLDQIQKQLKPYYDLILSNSKEIEELISLRDYLLPKLISGEIDVSDAEGIVDETL
ncbi:restriction endonuclease subunit S [Lentibacillus sp. Marseille-P4043]|uniref:restriction endonuclease subunit S n=1 Tax=Lentibacillus sp. Marseille-P4043 TaxID=2040293 RepID=UPI000D0BBAE9|nr:restriction endonuclease subunit S [Lentibacillus sp. Marseille-P4043]